MRALVTGSSGFIGGALVERMENEGHTIVRYDEKEGADVCDPVCMEGAARVVDVIFHQAARNLVDSLRYPTDDLRTNGLGAVNVLHAASLCPGIRVIMASTGSVLKQIDGIPGTPYGISKGVAEDYAMYYHHRKGVDVTVLRYFNVYGPGMSIMKRGVIGIFLRKAMEGKTLVVEGGDQVRNFCYVDDVVDANLFVLGNNETVGRIYEVGTVEPITIRELAERIIGKYGHKNADIKIVEPREGDDANRTPNNRDLCDLGWSPKVGLDEGLERTHQWLTSRR